MKGFPAVAVATLLGLVSLPACGKDIQTITLTPSSAGSHTKNLHDGATFSCWPFTCFHSHGTGCFPSSVPDGAQVGYNLYYAPGSAPCNCWWWHYCGFTGVVSFDLSALQPSLPDPTSKGIVTATLRWDDKDACVDGLAAPEGGWNPAAIPGNEFPGWPSNLSGAGELNVSITVRDFVLADKYSIDFVFLGPPHDLDFMVDNQASSQCLGEIAGLELEVEYTVQ